MKHNDARTTGRGRDHVPYGPNRPRCRLIGIDGNVYSIIGAVRRALRDAGDHEAAREFVERAFASRSYDEVLALVVEYVDPY